MLKSAQFIMKSCSFSNLNATSRNKRSCTELVILDNETDKVDSLLLVCRSVDQEQPLSKLSFLIDKAIKTAIGSVKEIKRL